MQTYDTPSIDVIELNDGVIVTSCPSDDSPIELPELP